MQFLSLPQSRAWAERSGYRINDAFARPLASELTDPFRFDIPEDAGARVALARVLWEASCLDAGEVLIWITDWSVWPSGEHMPMAEAARKGLGATHPLNDTPGHLVRLGEDDAGLTILCFAILFLWDCWVLRRDHRLAIFLSHDEFGVVEAGADDFGLRSRFDALGVAKT